MAASSAASAIESIRAATTAPLVRVPCPVVAPLRIAGVVLPTGSPPCAPCTYLRYDTFPCEGELDPDATEGWSLAGPEGGADPEKHSTRRWTTPRGISVLRTGEGSYRRRRRWARSGP
ncbi:hypothetical protein Scel_54390 [Streptomyces cellostaticus]|nr:hypothetical protein Scel_54390 [Streptomyces cellostaticus]